MKIKKIRFKNLNSLVGEWEIDLTHTAFVSNGIFAITGPTGAGKTTILDAICLALYGRTPRLNGGDRSEVMSRKTAECFAEVTFETQAGRYRCNWSQRRARGNPNGKLQQPQHEIANADNGNILESNIRGVSTRIEKTTGMDFDRFTRSMLLAQGGFAAFLQAAPDERAPILEQITGTEIYSQISIRVHERKSAEENGLNLLKAKTAGIVILEPEEEQRIRQDLDTKKEEEKALATVIADTKQAITWLTNIEGLRNELRNLTVESGQLQKDIDAFKPDRERLNLALNAASLDSPYATLIATRKQQGEDRTALKNLEDTLPGLESSAKEQAKALESAEQLTARTRKELEEATPILQNVRSLDQRLADLKENISNSNKDCEKDKAEIEANKNKLREEQEKHSEAHKTFAVVNGYLKEHAQDEWLIENLAGVEVQLSGLSSMQNEIVEKEANQKAATTALDKATKSLEDCKKQTGVQKQKLEKDSEKIQQANDTLSQLLGGDRSLREYRTEKETLQREMTFLKKIAKLEDYRAKLEDGKPCPLCGATDHPFAKGNVPVPDETENRIGALTRLIEEAEKQEAAIKELEKAKSSTREELSNTEKLESDAANEKRIAENALAVVKADLVKLRADFYSRRESVSSGLQPLGIDGIPETDISSLLRSLKARLKAWQDKVTKKTGIEQQIADINSEVKRLNAVINTQSNALAKKLKDLETLKNNHTTTSNERIKLYGDKKTDVEEKRLNKAITDAEGAERQTRERHYKLQQNWNTAKTKVDSLSGSIDRREPELGGLETDFSIRLAPVGFSNEEEFLAARIPLERRAELTAKSKDLDDKQTSLKATQTDRQNRLNEEISKKITDRTLEELNPQFEEYEEGRKELQDIIAGYNHRLIDNETAKNRIKENQTAIEAQRKECSKWENLHELIGSADGKKFRNFAQGLTFEMMIGHANRQLQKLTDRYLLTRNDAQPLELNVVDNYQAGEIRSTKNLSGGESFIVSLALALGLSQMASQNVRVDSLFLDEGFGSLDEEALDSALETLAGLQQDGKLIGVISHVPALKERISTQIQITPHPGGRSHISGPGCKQNAVH